MQKIWIALLCVFLAILIIGCAIYPKLNFGETVSSIVSKFSILGTAFTYVSNFIDSTLMFLDTSSYANKIESVLSKKETIYYNLSLFIPNHLKKYDLVDRCTDQGINVFTSKIDSIHSEHKVCSLRCQLKDYDGFGFAEQGGLIEVYYCSICNSICAMFIKTVKVDLGTKYLYPYEKSGQEADFFAINFIANTFTYKEVIEALY